MGFPATWIRRGSPVLSKPLSAPAALLLWVPAPGGEGKSTVYLLSLATAKSAMLVNDPFSGKYRYVLLYIYISIYIYIYMYIYIYIHKYSISSSWFIYVSAKTQSCPPTPDSPVETPTLASAARCILAVWRRSWRRGGEWGHSCWKAETSDIMRKNIWGVP